MSDNTDSGPTTSEQAGTGDAAPGQATIGPESRAPRRDFLSGSAIGGSLIVSGVTFVAVLLLSVIATLLVGLTALDHGLSDISSQAGIPSSAVTESDVSAQVLPIFLLLGSLALLGDVSVHLVSGSASIQGAFAVTPLLLTALIGLVSAWAGYAVERRTPTTTRSGLLLLSVASGLGLAIVWTLLVAIAHPSVTVQGTELSLSSGDARTFFGALVIVSAATLLGRWVARRDVQAPVSRFPREFAARLPSAPRVVSDAARVLLIGTVVFGVVTLIGGLVSIGTQVGWGTAFGTLLLWWGPLTLFAAAVGQFGALWALASGGSGGSNVSTTSFYSLLDNPLLWLLVLAAVVTAVVAGLRISQHRSWGERRAYRTAWQLPVLAAVAWLVLPWIFGLAIATGSGDIPLFGSGAVTALVTVAPWFFLIAGIWGAGVEAIARFAGPVLVTSYPLASRVAGGPRPATLESPAPLGASGRRGLAIGLGAAGVVVVLSIVIGGGISILGSTVFGPSAKVSAYLNQVAAGDLSGAGRTVPFPARGGIRVVSDKILAAGDRISQPRVDKVSVTGDRATATVSYQLHGARHTAQLSLASTGSQLLVFPDWHLTTPLQSTISVAVQGAKAVAVNGMTVPVKDGFGTLTVYPGRYSVTLPGDNKWLSATKQTVYATSDGSAEAELEVAPTAALKTEVDNQAKALIDSCVAQGIPAPTNCPFQAYTFGTVSGFHWTVKSYPEMEISSDGATFDLSGGQITADYVESYYGFSDTESNDASVFGFGKIVISGDKVSLAFSD